MALTCVEEHHTSGAPCLLFLHPGPAGKVSKDPHPIAVVNPGLKGHALGLQDMDAYDITMPDQHTICWSVM